MTPSPIKRYEEFLATKGRRLHSHAARVVDAAFSVPGTFNGEDIWEPMGREVSRASVYRTLSLLVEAELLRRVEFNGLPVYVAAAPR